MSEKPLFVSEEDLEKCVNFGHPIKQIVYANDIKRILNEASFASVFFIKCKHNKNIYSYIKNTSFKDCGDYAILKNFNQDKDNHIYFNEVVFMYNLIENNLYYVI